VDEIAREKGIDRGRIEVWFADEARTGQKNAPGAAGHAALCADLRLAQGVEDFAIELSLTRALNVVAGT
jgi:hypothetical protein